MKHSVPVRLVHARVNEEAEYPSSVIFLASNSTRVTELQNRIELPAVLTVADQAGPA